MAAKVILDQTLRKLQAIECDEEQSMGELNGLVRRIKSMLEDISKIRKSKSRRNSENGVDMKDFTQGIGQGVSKLE